MENSTATRIRGIVESMAEEERSGGRVLLNGRSSIWEIVIEAQEEYFEKHNRLPEALECEEGFFHLFNCYRGKKPDGRLKSIEIASTVFFCCLTE